MNRVPADYQRIINPWQTDREILLQSKFVEKVLKGKSQTERDVLLRLDDPERNWATVPQEE